MDNQLVQRYQSIQASVSKLETEKVKAQTELDLKEKELGNVIEQIKALGIDPDKLDEAHAEISQSFEKALTEAEMILNAVPKS